MTELRTDRSLAELVTDEPGAARVLESFGLDYCCGGRRRLADACAARDIDPTDVLEAIAELPPASPSDWSSMGPRELVDHLEATHHAYLHTELPRLEALADKVADVHGARHPELDGIATTYRLLRTELEPHLAKEEQVLFPLIRALADGGTGPDPDPDADADAGRAPHPFDSVADPIAVMTAEHDRAGELLASLRLVTADYTPPADGCGSYRALFDGLAELEADTHLHVHKENNVLFPAVLDLARARTAGTVVVNVGGERRGEIVVRSW